MPNKSAKYPEIKQVRFTIETIEYAKQAKGYLSTELRRLIELGIECDKKLKQN